MPQQFHQPSAFDHLEQAHDQQFGLAPLIGLGCYFSPPHSFTSEVEEWYSDVPCSPQFGFERSSVLSSPQYVSLPDLYQQATISFRTDAMSQGSRFGTRPPSPASSISSIHIDEQLAASPPMPLWQTQPETNNSLSVPPSPQDNTVVSVSENETDMDLPYAQLIYKALKRATNHKMSLKELYDWFEQKTNKTNITGKGWQNSIRHNLSMNAVSTIWGEMELGHALTLIKAFVREEDPLNETKGRGANIWMLTPEALKVGGVQSTTRYRKPKATKRMEPMPSSRHRTRKQPARRSRPSAAEEEAEAEDSREAARAQRRRARLAENDEFDPAERPRRRKLSSSIRSSPPRILPRTSITFADVLGCVETPPGQPIFYNADDYPGHASREARMTPADHLRPANLGPAPAASSCPSPVAMVATPTGSEAHFPPVTNAPFSQATTPQSYTLSISMSAPNSTHGTPVA